MPLPVIQLNWGSGFLPLLLPSQWPLSPADSPVLPLILFLPLLVGYCAARTEEAARTVFISVQPPPP